MMYGEDAPWYFMILVENYKYTRYANPDRIEELYDLDADPEELDNLAIKPQFKSKVLEMRAACIQSIKDNGGLVFADLLPTPTTETWWPPNLVASDSAHVLKGSSIAQDDSEVLRTKNGWGSADSRLAYLRFDLSAVGELDEQPVDSLLSVSLDLWMTQTEGDATNEFQVYALVDAAQDSPSDLSESGWTGSTGAAPLLGTNLPQGNQDPATSSLTTPLLGVHTFAASGDNSELGLVQIPLSVSDLKTLVESDTDGSITLIVRSTSQGLSVDFASAANTDAARSAPALTAIARPTPPLNLSAFPLSGRVLLDWDDHTDANSSSYRVYRASASGDYGEVLTEDLTESAFVDDTVSNGESYYYVVTAVDSVGNESNQSSEVVATPDAGSAPPGTVLFGSENQGFAGFTTSSPDPSQESWSLEPHNVRYINDDPDGLVNSGQDGGKRNGSLLGEFGLDRSVGNIYTIRGSVHLSDGYGDDNNRLGLYLFGGVDDLSGSGVEEDEAGALSLQINTEENEVKIVEGLDKNVLSSVDKNGTLFGDALFGTTLTLLANLEFVDQSGTDYIDVDFTLTDANGDVTALSHRVRASDYTGDYFGFATRARNRGITSSDRNAPFTMDYESFYLSWDNEPLDDFAQWAKDYGIGSDALWADDFDKDGMSNLYEYGLGGNPNDVEDQGLVPGFSRFGHSASYVYPRRADTEDLIYTVQTSTSLANDSWTATRYTIGDVDVTGGTHDFVNVDVETEEPQLFIKLKIEHQ